MTDKEHHVLLGEWLLRMGYPKDKFPSNEELKTLCVGKLKYFWKDVTRKVKPKQEIASIKQNIFVNAVRKYENVQNSTKAHLKEISPPDELLLLNKRRHLQAKIHRLETMGVDNDLQLFEADFNVKMKSLTLHQTKKRISNLQHELLRMADRVRKLDEEISVCSELASELTDIACSPSDMNEKDRSVRKNNFNPITPFRTQLANDQTIGKSNVEELLAVNFRTDSIDIEPMLKNINVDELWSALCGRREATINMMLNKASSASFNVDAEHVEAKLTEKGKDRSWSSSLASMHMMHCELMMNAHKHRKLIQDSVSLFQNLLKAKILPAQLSPAQIDLLKLQCKHLKLKGVMNSLKEDVSDITNGQSIFSKYLSNNDACEGRSIDNYVDDILKVHTSFSIKEKELHKNITHLNHSVPAMKKIQERVLNVLGYDRHAFPKSSNDDYNTINETAAFSFLSTDIDPSKYAANDPEINLVDMKKVYSESSVVHNLDDLLNVFLQSIEKSRKIFSLSDDFEKYEAFQNDNPNGLSLFDLIKEHATFKVVNPFKKPIEEIKKIHNLYNWNDTLLKLEERISKITISKITSIEMSDFNSALDISRNNTDVIMKKVDACLQPLRLVDKSIIEINENLHFFSTANLKAYLSDTRKFDGKTYFEHENEVRDIISEENYWSK